MSSQRDGGPTLNMSLRDYHAGKVLTGICSSNEQILSFQRLALSKKCSAASLIAAACYEFADAMLLERDK